MGDNSSFQKLFSVSITSEEREKQKAKFCTEASQSLDGIIALKLKINRTLGRNRVHFTTIKSLVYTEKIMKPANWPFHIWNIIPCEEKSYAFTYKKTPTKLPKQRK